MDRNIRTFLLFCFLFGPVVFGCGNQSLRGKVLFSDGEPLKTGTIMFSSGKVLSRSFIRPDGSFDVGSFKDTDGIPPGVYKVFIVGAIESVPDPKDPAIELTRPLIAAKFASRETTPLEIEVPGEKRIEIVVERPSK